MKSSVQVQFGFGDKGSGSSSVWQSPKEPSSNFAKQTLILQAGQEKVHMILKQ